jgi:hypothetical protein
MTISFFIRLFFVGLIRFVGLIGLILWYQNFEVSPLPEWTLYVALLLAQSIWTFLCTRWVLRHAFPTRHMMLALVGLFLIGQIILELWLTHRLTGVTWGQVLSGAAHWGGLLQISLHLGGIYLGYWRTKKIALREHASDEAQINGTV